MGAGVQGGGTQASPTTQPTDDGARSRPADTLPSSPVPATDVTASRTADEGTQSSQSIQSIQSIQFAHACDEAARRIAEAVLGAAERNGEVPLPAVAG